MPFSSAHALFGLSNGGSDRSTVVEAYPGILARSFIGRRSYIHDTRSKQTEQQYVARRELLASITKNGIIKDYGIEVTAQLELADDPTGDQLDALLCVIQAA